MNMREKDGGVAFAIGAVILATAYMLFRNVVDDAGVFYEGSNGLLRICLALMVCAAITLPISGKYLAERGSASTVFALLGVSILIHASVWAGSTQLHADRLSSGDTAGFVTQITSGVAGFMTGVWLLLFGLALAMLESEYENELPVDISRILGIGVSLLGVVYMVSGTDPRPWTVAAALAIVAGAMLWRTHYQRPQASKPV